MMWRKRQLRIADEERVIKDRDRASTRTMNRAVRLLAAKPRSVQELKDRLLEKSWTDGAIVDSVVAKLKSYNYLDDGQYARDLALSKLRQKPQGRRRLEQRLSNKKIDRETLDTAIKNAYEALPETELIDVVIDKRIRLKGTPATHGERKKFTQHLMRQGFAYSLIREKLQQLESEPTANSNNHP
ncbi:MAG TPA: regulatory protein RecX [Pyrinomonadaceae bacterium]